MIHWAECKLSKKFMLDVKLMATMAQSLLEVARTAAANLGYTSIKPEQESVVICVLSTE